MRQISLNEDQRKTKLLLLLTQSSPCGRMCSIYRSAGTFCGYCLFSYHKTTDLAVGEGVQWFCLAILPIFDTDI